MQPQVTWARGRLLPCHTALSGSAQADTQRIHYPEGRTQSGVIPRRWDTTHDMVHRSSSLAVIIPTTRSRGSPDFRLCCVAVSGTNPLAEMEQPAAGHSPLRMDASAARNIPAGVGSTVPKACLRATQAAWGNVSRPWIPSTGWPQSSASPSDSTRTTSLAWCAIILSTTSLTVSLSLAHTAPEPMPPSFCRPAP